MNEVSGQPLLPALPVRLFSVRGESLFQCLKGNELVEDAVPGPAVDRYQFAGSDTPGRSCHERQPDPGVHIQSGLLV